MENVSYQSLDVYRQLSSLFLDRDVFWLDFIDLFLEQNDNAMVSPLYKRLGHNSVGDWLVAPQDKYGFGDISHQFKKMYQAYKLAEKYEWIRNSGLTYSHILYLRAKVNSSGQGECPFPRSFDESKAYASPRYDRNVALRKILKRKDQMLDDEIDLKKIDAIEKEISKIRSHLSEI